jgi:lysophospholipase L1-like esterase
MQKTKTGRLPLLFALFVSFGLFSGWASAGATVATQRANLPPGSQYVAMGSSYAAGFLIGPQEPVRNTCGRSLIDYPHLVAAKLRLSLSDVSCGGAVTANALNTPQGSSPPQIDAVTPNTRLVTITIGGNDVNYVGTAIECGLSGSTCTARANPAHTDAAFATLPNALTKLIQAVRDKAPSAIIVLVTYPRLVPPTPCPALHYTPADARLVGSMGARLERVFVAVAEADHVRLADPYVLGATHGPCAQGTNKWVAGLVASNGFEYHPTSAGHQEMAHLVEQALAVS